MPTDYEFGKYYLVLDKKVTRHIQSSDNPHRVTKAQIGLSNVENLSPADMPLSTATKEEVARLDERIDKIALSLWIDKDCLILSCSFTLI